MLTFSSDGEAIAGLGGGLKSAGYAMQIMFILMAGQDMIITLSECCKRGDRDEFYRLYRYLCFCSCNNLVLLGLTIWGTVAFNSKAASECSAMDESAGCSAFLLALKVNVIVGYVYT